MVIFVGLPGRGKTVLAHKLERYLTWTNKVAKGNICIIINNEFTLHKLVVLS